MSKINSSENAEYVVTKTTISKEVSENKAIAKALKILHSRIVSTSFTADSSTSVKNYLKLKLRTKKREVFSVLFLDSQNKLIEYDEMFKGTISSASVYPREIARKALLLNCSSVILSHNHPSGVSIPSESDINITKQIKKCLGLFNIRILDHVIIGDDIYSFAESGVL